MAPKITTTTTSVVDTMLAGELASVAEAYKAKINDVFGLSWENAYDFMCQQFSAKDATILIMMAPIIVKSLTQKDSGKSRALLAEMSQMACLKDYKIQGRVGATDDINKSLLRVVSLVIVHNLPPGSFANDLKLKKAYDVVGKLQSVVNVNGKRRSEEASKVIMEVADKMGPIPGEIAAAFPAVTVAIFSASKFQ
jgi:hypothetical protein